MIRLDFKRNIKYWMVVAILLLGDLLAGWIAFSLTIIPYYKELNLSSSVLWISFSGSQLLWIILFYVNGRYRVDPTLSRFDEIQTLFKITLTVTIITVICFEIFRVPVGIPGRIFLQYWILFVTGLSIGRLLVRQTQKSFLKRGFGMKNTVIVGVSERAEKVARQLSGSNMGYNLVGFVTPDSGVSEKSRGDFAGRPVLGSLNSLSETIHESDVSEVIVALDRPNHDRLLDIITIANGNPVSLKIIPDMYEVVSGLARTEQLFGVPLVQINPEIMTKQQRFLKRLIDIVFASLVLVPLFPIWLIFSIAIKIDSRGPILYRQERLGLNGRRYMLNKFRSMVHNAESHTGPIWAKEGDPRITHVGWLLRRFRLDEIPQFINVLMGDMSVVGPRPERPYFVQKLMDEFPFYYRRYKVRPGITGWAQIKHSYDSTVDDVRQKLKYDFFYIENLSLSLDFLIMLRTAVVMLSGRGQ